MKKILGVLMMCFIVAGCSSNQSMTPSQKMSLISEYNQQKTFEIECETGCKVSYKDPRDQLNLPSETNGYDVMNTAIKATAGVITTAVPYAAIGVVATEGIRNAGDNVSGSYNSSSAQTSSVTSNSTDSVSTEYRDSFNETASQSTDYDGSFNSNQSSVTEE